MHISFHWWDSSIPVGCEEKETTVTNQRENVARPMDKWEKKKSFLPCKPTGKWIIMTGRV